MNQNNLPDNLELWEKTTNWSPNSEQLKLWQDFYLELLEINQHVNLTRITTVEDFWEKNLWDSLAPILEFGLSDKKIIDIGTGGGFPGLPIALTFPQAQLVLMDSTRKKINFINDCVQKLEIKNVSTIVDRAEVVGQDKNHRQKYDFATIRAVAEISVCAEYSLPLLKVGGVAILYRGSFSDEEKFIITKVADRLGGKVLKITNENTPIGNDTRHCIYLEKVCATKAKYPRLTGKPTKNPLR